jgi:hypothetical protein
MKDLSSYYQLPENVAPAGTVSIKNDLIDYTTGALLVDSDTLSGLTGETLETVVSASGVVYPVVITNEASSPLVVDVTNVKQSEVDTSLLGIPRSEVALGLFDAVNIYGVNTKEWTGNSSYTYGQDPDTWTTRTPYNYWAKHLPTESAIQAYCYPPPVSFTFPFDDGTGRFPGGYTDGIQTRGWETRRAFRYQPGRINGVTLGVRMSIDSGWDGEVIQWGCRNAYGDGYYFQLEKGQNLYIVYTSPNGTFKIPREEWNGDLVSIDRSVTGWVLDLSHVTMFKIEYGWYGAIGARFLAYVPVGHDEARWVILHNVLASNNFDLPSLRNPFLRIFTQVTTTAGCKQAAFINLYGSSVYIDGGDKGTVTLGNGVLDTEKNIDTTSRSIIGLQVKGQINGVENQKIIFPVSLAAYASVNARFDLVFQTGYNEQYGYGYGTALSRGASSAITVTRISDTVWQGTFPNITAELSGSTNYLTGRRVRVTGTNIYNTHVTAINGGLTQITTDRALPSSTTSIRLSRMDAYAVSTISIPSGITQGSIFMTAGGGQWRMGAWPQSSGLTYTTSGNVLWFQGRYTGFNFDNNGTVNGERSYPDSVSPVDFTVAVSSGTNSSTLIFGGKYLTVSGTNPWPIAIVTEIMDSSDLSDVVLAYGNDATIRTRGSGSTTAITTWTTSGVTQSATAAGGTSYVANKFEDDPNSPLSATLVDRQGYRVLYSPQRVATFFIASGDTKQFDLSSLFGPDKMFITGPPGSAFNSGALFVVATARASSGVASATINWEEQ